MANTHNASVDYTEGFSYVNYNGTLDLTGNLTDSHYSQAFLIGEANQVDGGFFAINSGGDTNADVDMQIEFSNDRENWQASGAIVLDGDGASAFADVGVSANSTEPFHAYRWARVVADGQTGNTATTTEWSLHSTKNEQTQVSTTSAGQVEDSIE